MAKTLIEFERKLEELNAEFAEFKKTQKQKAEIGRTVEIAGIEWLLLDKVDGGYLAITEEKVEDRVFDANLNDWFKSSLREYLNGEFLHKLKQEIGEDALVSFERDLLSADGQDEYGVCVDKVSILTFDEYRKYRKLLPNKKYYWWLLTPWSTKCNGYKTLQAVACPSGGIVRFNCNYGDGVRPVCIFSSLIFESGENNGR